MAEPFVRYEVNDGIAFITFFHPQSNSLPRVVLSQLASAIERAGTDENAKVAILSSEGEKAFCAGASFDELVAINSAQQGLNFFSGFAEVINAMRACPKFIVAAVHQKAVGGGVGLAASADYCLACPSASVKLSELAVGIGPFVVGPAVERKIGTAAFAELSIDASAWRSAQWAHQKGLYAELLDDREALLTRAKTLAKWLATSNPEAMAELKKVQWQGTDHWPTLLLERAAISGRLVLSTFTRAAIEKFKSN